MLDIYDSQPLADGDPFLVQGAAQHTVIVPSRRLMVPVLVVGTKSDLRPNADNATSVSADIATEYECLSMKMASCIDHLLVKVHDLL